MCNVAAMKVYYSVESILSEMDKNIQGAIFLDRNTIFRQNADAETIDGNNQRSGATFNLFCLYFGETDRRLKQAT
jgi:hypothetical protein